ncbi:hypothetical protein HOLleu_11477 [Holothuria leucospilota]|uniref:Uncharacterized protein n=1 Tax=Holothuria leucospilota TaxID=206669 RepID=A0A9Q1CG76_HOLLE|nr:hypothetical protein HOLleu_11477 [Holothuria leucospilota]
MAKQFQVFEIFGNREDVELSLWSLNEGQVCENKVFVEDVSMQVKMEKIGKPGEL